MQPVTTELSRSSSSATGVSLCTSGEPRYASCRAAIAAVGVWERATDRQTDRRTTHRTARGCLGAWSTQAAIVKTIRQIKVIFIIFIAFCVCWAPYIVVLLTDESDIFPTNNATFANEQNYYEK